MNKVDSVEEEADKGEGGESEEMGESTYNLEEEEEEKLGPIRRTLQKTWVRVLVYIGLTGYGAFSVLFDWLWVNDMLSVEKALVFGPANTSTIIALIFVSSIGTVAFGWEIISNAKKVCKKDPIIDEDLGMVFVLFVEEIPQTGLNVLLASCREMPISVYQLVKAALGILGAAIRVLRMLYHYFTPRKHGRRTGILPWILRTIVLAACVCVFSGSVLVFLYTFTEPPSDGDSGGDFRPPGSIIDKSYDQGRYLYRSGLYFSHPVFSQCNNNNMSWTNTSINWIKIEGLYEILDTSAEIGTAATFYYNSSTTFFHVDTEFKQEVCFMTSLPGCDITELGDCTLIPTDMDNIKMKFIHTDRTKTIVFGDIKVQALLTEGNNCAQMGLDDRGYLAKGAQNYAQIQYFQATEDTNDTFTYLPSAGGFQHYMVKEDLNYVMDVWLTGYKFCEMSGSLRPNLDDGLGLKC